MLAEYESLPSKIKAIRFEGSEIKDVVYWELEKDSLASVPYVITIHGDKAHIQYGDMLIQEPDEVHYYPCKPEIFSKKYRKVENV